VLSPSLGGSAPFLTGVAGGRVLSKYSGEQYGPKDTRLPLLDNSESLRLVSCMWTSIGVTGAFANGVRHLESSGTSEGPLLTAMEVPSGNSHLKCLSPTINTSL